MSAAARSLLAAAAAVWLAAAASAAPAAPVAINLTGSDALNTSYGPFYIPDGQTSGVIDDVLVCTGGVAPLGVKVVAEDHVNYPRVRISDSLRQASVLRAAPAAGETTVTVQLACPTLLPTA